MLPYAPSHSKSGHRALWGTVWKEHGAQVETGRSKVEKPSMSWCLSSGTPVSLRTQTPNSFLLQTLAMVTALPMAEQRFQVGEVVLKLTGTQLLVEKGCRQGLLLWAGTTPSQKASAAPVFSRWGQEGYWVFMEPCNQIPASLGRTEAWRQSWGL